MSTIEHVVIVGGGLAGARSAEALREQGFTGRVSLLAGESHLPYERPGLSKDYLAGQSGFDQLLVHPAGWYPAHGVDLRLGARAEDLDTVGHRVTLADGSSLGYDRLVLATGSSPRLLPIDGADADNVLTLRVREDADALRGRFGPGKRLVIIGAGWIGLEVAAAARAAGTAVTVLEAGALPLARILGAELGKLFAELHQDHGVDLRLGARVEGITTQEGSATAVRLAGSDPVPADTVLLGVGATPNTQLAERAGLRVDNGVLVDAHLATSDPHVYAVGDIANHDHPVLGHRVRVEHWATANTQPQAAAANILGRRAPYTDLPYFFSDQYDLGMEYVGHVPDAGASRLVVRGLLGDREFVAFWLDEARRIQAAMNVNVWDVHDQITPLIQAGTPVDPARLADPDIPYTNL